MIFFVGLHQPSDCRRVDRPCMVSINRLQGPKGRRSPFSAGVPWVMDSGAFTQVALNGGYADPPATYAALIRRWAEIDPPLWAASQDFMCEPFVLTKTGCTVKQHQRMTIERYDRLVDCDTGGVPVTPVLQGYHPGEYRQCLEDYGDRLLPGMVVGVGSVCKRNINADEILAVLSVIQRERPDLKLHGFGLKRTALSSGEIRARLASADSMAWSFAARRQGRKANDWREAQMFHDALSGRTLVEKAPSLVPAV